MMLACRCQCERWGAAADGGHSEGTSRAGAESTGRLQTSGREQFCQDVPGHEDRGMTRVLW